LEYFADGPNAGHCADAIEDTTPLVVPSITLLEVFKRISWQRYETTELQCAAVMQQGRVIALEGDPGG